MKVKNRRKIMIVENESTPAAALRMALKRSGYVIDGILAKGEDVEKRIKKKPPDVIFIGLKLGGEMDGIETAQKVRSFFSKPIIFISDEFKKEKEEEFKGIGPNAYISRVFDEKELIAIDNLSNFDIGDFEGDEIDISEDNEVEEEEEPKKELVLNLNEVHYDILESLSKITVTSGMQDAILIAAYYFHLLNDSDKVDETLLKATKEALFENAKIDIMS